MGMIGRQSGWLSRRLNSKMPRLTGSPGCSFAYAANCATSSRAARRATSIFRARRPSSPVTRSSMLPETSIAMAAASPSRASVGVTGSRACSISRVSRFGASATRPTDEPDDDVELSRHRPAAIRSRPIMIQVPLLERQRLMGCPHVKSQAPNPNSQFPIPNSQFPKLLPDISLRRDELALGDWECVGAWDLELGTYYQAALFFKIPSLSAILFAA